MNEKKKLDFLQIFTYFCLALALVSSITYMIHTILTVGSILDYIISIISVILFSCFAVLFVVSSMFAKEKMQKILIIICSLLLSFYSIFQVMNAYAKEKDRVLDFTSMDITEVAKWAEERDILLTQIFENSDQVEKYKVIRQKTKAGTPSKDVKNIEIVISDGPSETVKTEVTSLIGWKLDDVLSYIQENHLTNVTILFQFQDDTPKDVIFEQDKMQEIRRNEPITLVSSLGKEEDLKSVTLKNMVGMSTFEVMTYLGRNHLNYKIEYGYSENQEEGTVIKQSIRAWEVIDPKENQTITITVARKNGISIIDLSKMSATEITSWASKNRLKVEFQEEFDEAIQKGKVISYSPPVGSTMGIDSTIQVVISKGPLRMIDFTDFKQFYQWAEENEVSYQIDYQFSNEVENGKIISCNYEKNQIIQNGDTIRLVISQGKSTIIPGLIGLTKEEAEERCKKANIQCKYLGEENGKVIKQSMKEGSNVPIEATVTLTLE